MSIENSHLANFHSSLVVKTPDAATTSLQMTPLYGLCGKPAVTIIIMVGRRRMTDGWSGLVGKGKATGFGLAPTAWAGSLGLLVIRAWVWGSPRGLVGFHAEMLSQMASHR